MYMFSGIPLFLFFSICPFTCNPVYLFFMHEYLHRISAFLSFWKCHQRIPVYLWPVFLRVHLLTFCDVPVYLFFSMFILWYSCLPVILHVLVWFSCLPVLLHVHSMIFMSACPSLFQWYFCLPFLNSITVCLSFCMFILWLSYHYVLLFILWYYCLPVLLCVSSFVILRSASPYACLF